MDFGRGEEIDKRRINKEVRKMVKMADVNINKPDQFIYTIFDEFLKKIICDKKSFITPEKNQEIFSEKNINKIEELFIENFDGTKGKHFEDKIQVQFKDADDNCKHIFTNLLYLRYLPIWEVPPETKVKKINPFKLELANPFNLEVNKYFPCVGISSYSRSLQTIYEEMVELIFLFHYLLKQSNTDNNESNKLGTTKEAIKKWVLNDDECKTKFYGMYLKDHQMVVKQIGDGSRTLAIDHMLLNLCYPEKYSRIATMSTKRKIVTALHTKYFKNKGETESLENCLKFEKIDQTIGTIAKNIVTEKKMNRPDDKMLTDILWDKDCRLEWEGGYVANAYEILTQYQKQVILYGAPGTGKTYSAEQIIKEFIYDAENNGEPKDIELKNYQYKDDYDWTQAGPDKEVELTDSLKEKNVIWEMVQFNQSYSYENFIEGLRPTENGGLKTVHGIFKRFATVAAQEKNKDKKFIFVIDEINRGKIDKIFGELLYLLEYRDKSLRLHYSNIEFSIPENVYIIGTMNTADKSIALLDVALRRRFWFVRCEPKRDVLFEKFGIKEFDDLTYNGADTPDDVKKLAIKLFDWLNGYEIRNENKKPNIIKGKLEELGNDADELKIGHSYFLKLIRKTDDEIIEPTFSDLKNIWFYSIVPLIEEYCGFDKNRVEELLTGDKKLSKKEDFTLNNLKGKWN